MKTYDVKNFGHQIDWQKVESLTIDTFPWFDSGLKQATYVQLARTNQALHLKVKAIDCHSSASVLENNGSVYLDSCFEFFFTPSRQLQEAYINLEINCIGTVYFATRDQEAKRRGTLEQIGALSVDCLYEKGKVKLVSEEDQAWTLDIRIPFDLVEALYNSPIDWQMWHCNFYRCGGSVDDQYATWNPIDTPSPDFHQPKQFGQLVFI